MTDDTILDLKRDFCCEALDLAYTHMAWVSRHLQEGRDEAAIAAWDKFVVAIRATAEEIKPIRAAMLTNKVNSEAAAEYRAQRDAGRTSCRREVSPLTTTESSQEDAA